MKLRMGVVTFAVLAALPASAGVRDDVIRAMDQCTSIAGKDERLACFDKLEPLVKAAMAQAPRSGPATAEEQKSWFGFDFGNLFGNAPSQQTTPEKFGSDALPQQPPAAGEAAAPEALDSIGAKVTEYSFTPFGKFIVFLDNGQVWRQIEGDTGAPMFSKHGENAVTISRGGLGSYSLMLGGSSKVYKVKRMK